MCVVPVEWTSQCEVLIIATHLNAILRALGGMQNQIAVFLASGGVLLDHPEPARFFEVPAAKPRPRR